MSEGGREGGGGATFYPKPVVLAGNKVRRESQREGGKNEGGREGRREGGKEGASMASSFT